MRILSRILRWTLGIIALLVLLLVGSITVEGVLGSGRIDALTNTRITGTNGLEVRAFVARPDGTGPFPAVIMVHEWWGLTDEIVGKAQELAKQGYVVVAPDTLRGSSTSWIPRAIYQVSTAKPEQINADIDAVFAWLQSEPTVQANNIAIMGFCYGGRTALNYSIHNPQIAATATFYGMAETTPNQLRTLRGPVLGIWAGADQSISLADVHTLEQNLEAAGVAHTFHVFEGQPHAFVRSVKEIKQGGPQAEAWNELLIFLDASLKQAGAAIPQSFAGTAGTVDTTLLGTLHHIFVCKL